MLYVLLDTSDYYQNTIMSIVEGPENLEANRLLEAFKERFYLNDAWNAGKRANAAGYPGSVFHECFVSYLVAEHGCVRKPYAEVSD